MDEHKITLTATDLGLISSIFHEYKDIYRGCKEILLPVMNLEKKIMEQTAGIYEGDPTYDWKD